MENVLVGTVCTWISAKGYSLCGGERAEVFRVDAVRRIASVNTAGDAQSADGYSYAVSFDELNELTS